MSSPRADPGQVTHLLRELRQGHSQAASRLMELIYPNLRRMAAHIMRQERPGHSLQPTEIVHETYLRLIANADLDWRDRAHFFGIAARMMRRILVDHARKRLAAKRGGSRVKVDFENAAVVSDRNADQILEVDRILSRLEQVDARLCRIVELRFFGGMTEEETAEALAISAVTVKRDWRLAKAWLYEEMTSGK